MQTFGYHEAREFDFSQAPVYRSTETLEKSSVRTAEKEEKVVMRGPPDDGGQGGLDEKTAFPGDKIFRIPEQPFYSGEVVIRARDFAARFEEDPADPSRYRSKSVRVIGVTEDTKLTRSSGKEEEFVYAGGFVAQRVDNPSDIFLIGASQFAKSYEPESTPSQPIPKIVQTVQWKLQQ